MPLLEIRDLVVRYGEIEALRGISLGVDEGQVVTLLGANGAGKSTTLRAISGLDRADGHFACAGRPAGIPRLDGEREHHAWRVQPQGRILAAVA
jgi:branched-chain amino acid transport system ATP-binding protein